jgi:uncharacterized protein (DUF2384 family)
LKGDPGIKALALTKEQSSVVLTAFHRIADAWRLDEDTRWAILGCASQDARHLIDERPLSADQQERVSYVLGIYIALHTILPQDRANDWMARPNQAPLLAGRSAVDLLRSGRKADLRALRRYLDAHALP